MLSRLPYFRKKENKAISDIIAALYRRKGYVSLSWGKQSTVLAHMVYSVSQYTPCVFWKNPTSDILNNFNEVRDLFLSRWQLNYIEYQDGDTDLVGNGNKFLENNGLQVVFMGLVSSESKARKFTLGKADENNCFHYSNGKIRCCPLKNWSNQDIAAYIAKYKLPFLKTYAKFGFDARTSAGVTPGSHAEKGMDILSRSKQQKIKDFYALQSDI